MVAVIKVHKTKGYTVMSNHHLREKEMGLKAKGLLSLMFSLPEDWDYSIAGLVTLSKDGKDSVMTALKELEHFGYLVRTRLTDELGRFNGYDYDIYEEPNPTIPKEETPYAEKPNMDNPPQLITNQPKTDELTKEKPNDKLDKFDKEDKIGESNDSTIVENDLIKNDKEFIDNHNQEIANVYLKPTALTKMVIKAGYISKDDPYISEYNKFLIDLTNEFGFEQVRDCISYFFSMIKNRRDKIDDRFAYFKGAMEQNVKVATTDMSDYWNGIYALAGGK